MLKYILSLILGIVFIFQPCQATISFPENVEELAWVTLLGGSTCAMKMKDSKGHYWVKKEGKNNDHCLNESDANQAYQALHVPVPSSQLYINTTNTEERMILITQFIEGKTLYSYLASATPEQASDVKRKLKRFFVIDCLLGNWDVIGLLMDNIIVDQAGTPWRIDNGGSLEYRAQGDLKEALWNPIVSELETMIDPKINPSTARIFEGIEIEEILEQISEIEQYKEKLLQAVSEKVRPMLQLRFEYLLRYTDELLQCDENNAFISH